MKLINIGFGNLVSGRPADCQSSAPESAPIKRMIQEAREQGRTALTPPMGAQTCAVLVMDNDHLILSALSAGDCGRPAWPEKRPDGQEEEGATWPVKERKGAADRPLRALWRGQEHGDR